MIAREAALDDSTCPPGVPTGDRHVREQLPNLVIAGVAKGGTTSLFRYLSQHPDICASRNKELRYFDAVRYGQALPPIESYSRHFAHWAGHRYRMEATPGYFSGGRPVAEAARALLEDAHVLVSLREPVQRCWSWYRFVRGRARIPRDLDFDAYLDVCEGLHASGADSLRENQPYMGLRGGCYDEWIDAWQELFGARLHVLFFDDLVDDPARVIMAVLRELELDAGPAAAFRFSVENASVQYRSRPMLKAALVLNRRGERFFERHARLKRALRGAYYLVNKESDAEGLQPEQKERLAAFYRPHNARLAVSLRASGTDHLPAWLPTAPERRGDGGGPGAMEDIVPHPRPPLDG